MKIYIVVTDIINDVAYSRKSVTTHVVITVLLHDVIHLDVEEPIDPSAPCRGFL